MAQRGGYQQKLGGGSAPRGGGYSGGGPSRGDGGSARPEISVTPAGAEDFGKINIFRINVAKGKVAYRYDVVITVSPKNKLLSKAGKEGARYINKILSRAVLQKAYEKTDGFGSQRKSTLVYDGVSVLYASEKLSFIKKSVSVTASELTEPKALYYTYKSKNGDLEYIIQIDETKTGHILDLNDYEQYKGNTLLLTEDHSLRTFLELATSQHPINKGTFEGMPPRKLVKVSKRNYERLNEEVVLRTVVVKGVNVVVHNGVITPVVNIERKITPFFATITVSDVLEAHKMDYKTVARILKDVTLSLSYAPSRLIIFSKFYTESVNSICVPGAEFTCEQYFCDRYQIVLRKANYLAVIPESHIKDAQTQYYPPELLNILPNQVVPLQKLTNVQRLHKANVLYPNERYNAIMDEATEICLFNNNPILNAFGITVVEDSNPVKMEIQVLPRIQYANNIVINVNPQDTCWRGGNVRYIESRPIKRWMIFAYNQDPSKNAEWQADIKNFAKSFIQTCRNKGLQMEEPHGNLNIFNNMNWFKQFKIFSVDFMLFVNSKDEKRSNTDDFFPDSRELRSHDCLKFLECYYKNCPVTQNVSIEIVRDVVHKKRWQTLENIVNKTNPKHFGHNNNPLINRNAEPFNLLNGKTLVIGLDLSHPATGTDHEKYLLRQRGSEALSFEPSVLGYSANMAKNAYTFIGDYAYQKALKEAIDGDLLTRVTHLILKKWVEIHNNKLPENVFVFRDAVSDGEKKMVMKTEMPAIREACRQYSSKWTPKFLCVTGSKRHFKRLFKENNPRQINPLPGSLLHKNFANNQKTNFLLQSAQPLQGTAKPVEYHCLINQVGIKPDQLFDFLLTLCYDHQIVNKAISMPEPIYQADELAKRGKNNFSIFSVVKQNEVPRLDSGEYDFEKLTEILSYEKSHLNKTRFTA